MEQTDAHTDLARFVILRHEGSVDYKLGVHWDLMFQCGRSLKTWALAELPAAGRAVDADQLPDHRPAYLDYEGPISGGRGSVRRWDQGHFQIMSESAEQWIVTLAGRELRGRLVLCRAMAGSARWQCTFDPDTTALQ